MMEKAEKVVKFAKSMAEAISSRQRELDNASQRKQLNLTEDDVVPQEFKCPITQEKMKDPVMASDGHSYERAALETHLMRSRTSPLDRSTITSHFPNHNLRKLIVDHEE